MNIITTIEFRSWNEFYNKESAGNKSNTVRIVTKKEDQYLQQILKTIEYIRIKNVDGIQSFTRKLTDITRYTKDNMIFYIFSW